MNAISSGINKGAVKVAPKAGGSRRSRQQQTKLVVNTGTYEETQKESAVHPMRDHSVLVIDNTDSIKNVTSRAIPVVGRSAKSISGISASKSRQNDQNESIDVMQPTASLLHKSMPRAITDDADVAHESADGKLQDSKRSTQARRRIPSRLSGIDIRESGTQSTTSATDNASSASVTTDPETVICMDSSRIPRTTPSAVHQAQAALPDVNALDPGDITQQLLQAEEKSYKRSRKNVQSRHKMREPTPEAAEFEVIDTSDVRMLDLCKDLRKGRKSTKYEQFKRLAAARKQRRSLEASAVQVNITPPVDAEVDTNNESGISSTAQETKSINMHEENELKSISDHEEDEFEEDGEQQVYLQEVTRSAPQVRIVDGKIVLDVGSLQVDRSARDATGSSAIEYVEEDPLEKTVNSRSYSKHKLTPRWDALATELFYTGLSQWGTDFDMISRMFPTRTRKQIKNKFSIEEKRNPTLVTRALLNKEPVDMQEYSRISEIEFRSVAELEQDLDELKSKFAKEREEALEEAQQRKLEVLSGLPETPSVAEPRKKRHRGVDTGIEVLGNIEEVEEEERRAAARAAASSEGEDEDEDDDNAGP